MHYIFAYCKEEIINVPSFHVAYRRDVLYFVQSHQLQTQNYGIVFCSIPQSLAITYF